MPHDRLFDSCTAYVRSNPDVFFYLRNAYIGLLRYHNGVGALIVSAHTCVYNNGSGADHVPPFDLP